MKGRIVSRPSPATQHVCPTPTFLSRWLHRMKEGTVWECGECRHQWELKLECDVYGCCWRWVQTPTPDYTWTISTGVALDPDDPGPILTTP